MSEVMFEKISDFKSLLNIYRENAKTEREKGTYFENLVIIFLENDARFLQQFIKVQKFSDWAKDHNFSGNDTGIDLVATNSEEYGGGYSAIQCKFYDQVTINKNGIDSFIASSDKTYFNRRILIDTSFKGLSEIVQKQLENSSKEFTRISLDEFETSSIDWAIYFKQGSIKALPKKQLRKHQIEALDATVQGFNTTNRGKLFMACGTGKTFTALKIAENITGESKASYF